MGLPHLSGVAELGSQPSLEYRGNKPVTLVDLLFTSTKRRDGKLVEGDRFEISGIVFGNKAVRVAEDLGKGDQVMVTGRMKTDVLNTDDGKVSVPVLFIDVIGEPFTDEELDGSGL